MASSPVGTHTHLIELTFLNSHTAALQNMSGPEDFQHGTKTMIALFVNFFLRHTLIGNMKSASIIETVTSSLNQTTVYRSSFYKALIGRISMSITSSHKPTSAEPCVNTLIVILLSTSIALKFTPTQSRDLT